MAFMITHIAARSVIVNIRRMAFGGHRRQSDHHCAKQEGDGQQI